MGTADRPRSPFAPGASLQPAEPSLPGEPDQPRLSILHLLVWTSCVAAWLGWHKTLFDLQPMGPPALPARQLAITVISSLATGIGLGGLLLWIARRWRGLRFPVHPGEYLAVVLGLSSVWQAAVHAALFLKFLLTEAEQPFFAWPPRISGLNYVALAVFWLWARRRVQAGLWRKFFLVAALDQVLEGSCIVARQFSTTRQFLMLGPLLVLLAAILSDRSAKRSYPWTHWCGVAAYAWLMLWALAWTAWYWFQYLSADFS